MSVTADLADGSPSVAVLHLTGDVDALTVGPFRSTADALLEMPGLDRLVVDMHDVTTIDSSGLGLLVAVHTAARDRDVEMTIVRAPLRTTSLLRRTGLDRVFTIDPG